jgi:hypothetical protein
MEGTRDLACDHADAEFLGGGGSALYYRCAACGEALVVQGGKRWALQSISAPA